MGLITPPSHEALLALEKSSDTPQQQLSQAYNILGLAQDHSHSSVVSEDRVSPPPTKPYLTGKHEWVLRWVLARLRDEETWGPQFRCHPPAWRLLVQLVRLVPIPDLARLLQAHGFLALLNRTLEEVIYDAKSSSASNVSPTAVDQAFSATCVQTRQGSGTSESSHTIAEGTPELPPSVSKKRKRSVPAHVTCQKARRLSPCGRPSRTVGELLSAVLGVLDSVKAICHGKGHPTLIDQDLFQREYLRSALCSTPELAARLMGSFLELSNLVLSDTARRCASAQGIDTLDMESILTIWESRSGVADDLEGNTSNDEFSNHCLLPIVLLTDTLKKATKSSDHANAILLRTLQRLLAQHLIVPARRAFVAFTSTGPQADKSSAKSQLLQQLLSPLAPSADSVLDSGSRLVLMQRFPLLFQLFIQCSRVLAPRAPIADRAWLQSVFTVLLDTAGITMTAVDRTSPNSAQRTVLQDMLQSANASKITLDTELLQSVAERYCGLGSTNQDQVDWTLCERILTLDADVFLVPSSTTKGSHEETSRSTPLMELLFKHITSYAIAHPPNPNIQRPVQQDIFLSLIKGFANARDLTGFFHYWRRELASMQELRDKTAPQNRLEVGHRITLLDDELVSSQIKGYMERSLTARQVRASFDAVLSSVGWASGSGLKQSTAPDRFAALVLIDIMVEAVTMDDTVDLLRDTAATVYGSLLKDMSTWSKSDHGWRAWRILSRIEATWGPELPLIDGQTGKNLRSKITKRLLPASRKTVTSACKCGEIGRVSATTYLQAVEAFRFVCGQVASTGANDIDREEALVAYQEMLEHALDYLEAAHPTKTSISADDLEAQTMLNAERYWDGTFATLDSPFKLCTALFAQQLLQFPSLLVQAPPLLRQRLLGTVCKLASESTSSIRGTTGPTQVSFGSIWIATVQSEPIMNVPGLKDEVIKALLETVPDGSQADGSDHSTEIGQTALHSAIAMPLQLFNRSQRKTLLDHLCQTLKRPVKNRAMDSVLEHMSLMLKLLQKPNPTAQMTSEPAEIWLLAASLDRVSEAHLLKVISLFDQLVRGVLRPIVSDVSSKRHQVYLRGYHTLLSQATADTSLQKPITLNLISASLQIFWQNKGKASQHIDMDDLKALRKQSLVSLKSFIKTLLPTQRSDLAPGERTKLEVLVPVVAALRFVDDDTGLSQDDKAFQTILRALSPLLPGSGVTHPQSSPDWSMRDGRLAVSVSDALALAASSAIRPTEADYARLLDTGLPRSEAKRLLRSFLQSFQTKDEQQKLHTISRLVGDAKQGLDSVGKPLLLGTAIAAIDGPSEERKQMLIRVCSALVETLCRSLSFQRFKLVAECLILVLLRKPWAVSQWTIESTLGAIVVIASSSGPPLPAAAGADVFQSLTRLMGAILTVHQLKLRGRFHLVVQVMNALLRLLFVPNAKAHKLAHKISVTRPSWAAGRSGDVGAPEAAGYGRLLTSICNASVSAVTTAKRRPRPELTPATDKAKKLAGQHMPYVLVEYAQCQLHSRMAPEAKMAMLPGLYAIFSVTPPETLRMLNASMDASSRAIFKSLYDDYRRFGRWMDR
ncbi:MAG: hypothetical protein M1817_004077 [Caeruleum heppii]|nr:MAG: hypothetical protein M1817_004077 [Caeruleum heppii]